MALLAGTEYIIDIGKSLSLESQLPFSSWNVSGVANLTFNGSNKQLSFSYVSYSPTGRLFSVYGITYQGYDDFTFDIRSNSSHSVGKVFVDCGWNDGDDYAILTSCSLKFNTTPDFGDYQSLFESCLSNPSPDPEPELTDLTGTKWVFNNTGFSVDTDSFAVEGNFIDTDLANSRFTGIRADSGDLQFRMSPNGGSYDWESIAMYLSTPISIEITGGIDVTNADLIVWLQANATQVQVITDLTGTKWVINDGLDPTSFIGKYNGWQINFKSNGNDYTAFGLQYDDADPASTGIIYYPPSLNWVAHQEESSPYLVRFSNEAYRIIEITGGTDATNATFIAWLSQNAIQIPVADLTGTTWVFNNSLNFPLDDVDYSIDFKSNNTDFNLLSLTERDVTGEGDYAWILFYGSVSDYLRVYLDEWEDVNYKTIQITGGTDATNSDLILWLQANAVQQVEPEPTGVKNILFGTLSINKILFGQSEVNKIYLGQTLIWQA